MSDLFFPKKRVLIFGASGVLGKRTCRWFAGQAGYEVMAGASEPFGEIPGVSVSCIDFTQREAVRRLILDFFPDIIINTETYANVDSAETERELVWKMNVRGVEDITDAARIIDAHVLHVSSDFVFDGVSGPYSEIDKPNPLGYWGRTKLASENVLHISGVNYTILRVNEYFGLVPCYPDDFVHTVIDSVRHGRQVYAETDQILNPTYIDDVVQAIGQICKYQRQGLYHIAGMEILSRYRFALKIASAVGAAPELVVPAETVVQRQASRRPRKSGLVILKAQTEIGFRPLGVDEALQLVAIELETK